MSEFKVGDKVWAINQFAGGNYYPSFCEYLIIGLRDEHTPNEYAILDYIEGLTVSVYTRFCFHTKQEAIDAMIAHVKTL